MTTLTDKDWRKHRVPERSMDVLRSIAHFRRLNHDYGPTVREIQVSAGISSEGMVLGYLRRLRKEGLVKFVDGVGRSVQMTELGWQRVEIAPPCFVTI